MFVYCYISTGEDEQDTKLPSLQSASNLRGSSPSYSTALVASARGHAPSTSDSTASRISSQLQNGDEDDAISLLYLAEEVLRIVGEYNDIDIEQFVYYALQQDIGIRGYLRGSRSHYRQQLRRLARDFHHRLNHHHHQQQHGDFRDDVIEDTARMIRASVFYEEYHILSEYLIRILQDIQEGDIIPISMLLCPHPNKSLHCGGWGCHGKSCPTIRNLIKFAESLPQGRIRFGNAGQPIDNMMVLNIREKCSGTGCMNYGDIVESESPTPKPTCYGATEEEGRATATLLNWFATAAMFLGASGIIIFNHGGSSLKTHFFPYLNQDSITTSADGVHISLYSRRFKLPWRSRWIQGNRITGIVDQHCKDWSAFLTEHSMPLTKSILQSLSGRLPFVNSDFIDVNHSEYNAGALRSARRFVRRGVENWNNLVNRFGVDRARAELRRLRSERIRRGLQTAANARGTSVSDEMSRRTNLGNQRLNDRVGEEVAQQIRSDRRTLGDRRLEERVGEEVAQQIRSDRVGRGFETAAAANGLSVSDEMSRRRTLGYQNAAARLGLSVIENVYTFYVKQ